MNGRKVFAIVFGGIVVLGAVAICIIVLWPRGNGDNTPIQAGTANKYYIYELRPGAFKYSNGTYVTLLDSDHSYAYFAEDFKMLNVCFEGPNQTLYKFLVTNLNQNKNNISADIQYIVDGRIVRYKLESDSKKIKIMTNTSYTVHYGGDSGEIEETVTRTTTVLSFSRTAPGYITE